MHWISLKCIDYTSEFFKISGKLANTFLVNTINYFNIIKK